MRNYAVTAAAEVPVDPATAFAILTEEVGQWWRPGPYNWNNRRRAIGMRIEPGVGGRWIEIHDAATGEGFELGKITVWEPGSRLVFLYRDAGEEMDRTEVEVRFEAMAGNGTRLTLEHRGWKNVSADIAAEKRKRKRSGWKHILGWYSEWAPWGSPKRIGVTPDPGPACPQSSS